LQLSAGFAILFILLATAILQVKGPNMTVLIPGAPYMALALQVFVPFIAWPMRVRLGRPFLPILIAIMLLIGVFIFSLLSAYWSNSPRLVAQRSLMVWVPALLIALLSWSDTKPAETFVRLCFGIWMFALFLAVIGLALYTFGTTSRQDDILVQSLTVGPVTISQQLVGIPPFWRISSLAGNANTLALWCAHATVLGLYLHDTRRIGTPVFVTSSFLLAAALLLTFSRAGIAAFFMWLLLYLLLHSKKRQLVVVLFLLSAITIVVAQRLSENRILRQAVRIEVGLNIRDLLWAYLWQSFTDRVWTGVGFGVSQEEILEMKGFEISGHNGHLIVLSEIGIVGYMVLVVVWMLPCINLLLLQRSSKDTIRISKIMHLRTLVAILLGMFAYQLIEGSWTRWGFHTLYWVYLCIAGLHPGLCDASGLDQNKTRAGYVV
jgi:hypothetical protein